MIEHCACCLSWAPSWEEADYSDWFVGLTDAGAYLGVVCPTCFVDELAAFDGLAPD